MKFSFGKILIGVAVFGVCLGAAFAAGTVYGRHSTTQTASAASITSFNRGGGANGNAFGNSSGTGQDLATQSATPQAGGPTARGQGFLGGFGSRPIEAKVDSVTKQQLQVTLATGTSMSIALDDQTTYAASQKADKSALTSGANVYVMTSAASDGSLSATSIIILPASQQTAGEQNNGAPTGSRGGFRGGAANRPIDGTVASIDGQQLQVTLANGSTSTIALSDQTTYATTQSADQSAVTSGSSVLVTISRSSDGSVTAQSVIVLPATGQTS